MRIGGSSAAAEPDVHFVSKELVSAAPWYALVDRVLKHPSRPICHCRLDKWTTGNWEFQLLSFQQIVLCAFHAPPSIS